MDCWKYDCFLIWDGLVSGVMLVSGSLNGWPTVFRCFKTSESNRMEMQCISERNDPVTINKSTTKSWNKNNLQKFEQSAKKLSGRPFWVALLKKLFLSLSAVFVSASKQSSQSIKLQGSSMDSASATRRPSKWLQKWRPGNSRKFRSEAERVQHSWLICKGTQQKYTKLALLFKGQKESPWPWAFCVARWCHDVIIRSVMSTSCYMSK